MATLPTAQDLGVVTPQSPRGVGGYNAGVAERAAAEVGQQGRIMGAQLENLGETIVTTNDRIAYANGISSIYAAKVDADEKFKNDPDWRTAPKRYGDLLNAQADRIASTITSPAVRAEFQNTFARRVLADGVERMQNIADARTADIGRATLLEQLDTNTQNALRSDDPTTRAGLLDANHTALQAAVAARYISATEAYTLGRATAEKYALGYAASIPDPYMRRAALSGSAAASGAPPGPMDPNLETAIQAANEAHPNLPPHYLAATAHIEGGGSAAPPDSTAGARGPFQMMPDTASMVGADPHNPYSAAEGAAVLAERNATMMRPELGRQPTGAELYLAHQQGAGGAMALIENPDENAVDAIAKFYKNRATAQQAIVGNGGSERQTAGQFVAMWTSRYNSAAGGLEEGTKTPPGAEGGVAAGPPATYTPPPLPTDEAGVVQFKPTGTPIDILDPAKRVELIHQADNEIEAQRSKARADWERQNAEGRAIAADTVTNQIAYIGDNGKLPEGEQQMTREQLVGLGFKPAQIEHVMRSYKRAYDTYTVTQQLSTSSRENDDRIIASSNKPTVGNQNLIDADAALNLTPEERYLYETHLHNLETAPVKNSDGSTSTLLQTSAEVDGRFYNIPTVWDGKIHSEDEANHHAAAIGWSKFPSYSTREDAEARYQQMHAYMDKDIQGVPVEDYAEARATSTLLAQKAVEKWKQIGEDSAGWLARNNPTYSASLQAALDDPSKMASTMTLADQLFDKLQVPQDQRQYLPRSMAQQLTKTLTSAPPAKLMETMDAMAAGYGPVAWPKVFGSMQAAGLPPGALVLPLLGQSKDQISLSKYLGLTTKQQEESLGRDASSKIDKELDQTPGLLSMRAALSKHDGGNATMVQLTQGARMLARALTVDGMDPVVAADHAADALTTDRYDFVGTAYTPKGMGAAMTSYAQAALDVSLDKLRPLQPGFGPLRGERSTAVSEEIKRITRDNAQHGYWVTVPGEDGWVRFGANGNPVLLDNGQPLLVSLPPADYVPPPPAPLFSPPMTTKPGATTPSIAAPPLQGPSGRNTRQTR